MTSNLIQWTILLLLAWVAGNAFIVLAYRHELARLWREPVFRHPILIVESDDWGAGPLSQAVALRDIIDVLALHCDVTGRTPVLSLALVLAVPDGPAIATGGGYQRICLDDAMFAPILSILREGQFRGVFALQLHGMEHYWPQTLMTSDNAQVRGWLTQPPPAVTEELQSHLQSRWVNAARLPSTLHPPELIRAAVAEEVEAYTRILGQPPQVVVPPTFVWTRATELAWMEQGVRCIVTPGWRYCLRDAQGLPAGDEGPIVNGDRSGSVTYLVRTDYFEPRRGRDAEHALRALSQAAVEGRVCLLENHRDNFITDRAQHQQSLAELDKLYREALMRHGDLRFLSSSDLATVLRDLDPQWLILDIPTRQSFVWERIRQSGRLWKLMVLTGMAAIGTLHLWLFGASSAESAGGRHS